MHVNVQSRFNKQSGDTAPYYRLKESYRDVRGNVHSLILLNIGFEPSLTPKQMHLIAKTLTKRFNSRTEMNLFGSVFDELPTELATYARKYWKRMVDEGQIDRFHRQESASNAEKEKYVDVDTITHTDARNVGAEWLCKQAIDNLGLENFLRSKEWSQRRIDTVLSHLVVRTVYSPSELATHRIMTENSAACELFSGARDWVPGINSLYQTPDELYSIKDELESHLCRVTDNLFNIDNKIVLFDLTNFYFEGRKELSKKAKFGRSKEKRSDCKIEVLALCINREGFPRYTSLLEGNTADPKSLPDMVETLAAKNRAVTGQAPDADKTLVVIDAGIATEENLRLISEKGFNYLCVSRTRPKDYTLSADCRSVVVRDVRKRPITLTEIQNPSPNDTDYYLQINSPSKEMKEASMNRQWKERFETEMQRVNDSLQRKGGTKTYEKVIERVGRVRERFPSISKYYDIEYARSEENTKLMKSVTWSLKDFEDMDKFSGIYFLRTNRRELDEKTTWEYYNLIRDIECTNRQLKTDLNLRPIHHQKDSRTDAHLFFGILAYWIVNTIRYKLSLKDENCYWTEIVRRMSTQKLVTSEAVNALGEKVQFRLCSKPTKAAKEIYEKLDYQEAPFKKIKICRTQPPPS